MKKKILFFSSILPDVSFFENSIGQTATANDTLQRSMMKGFQENGYSVDIINVPNIGAYPSRYKKAVILTKKFELNEKIKGISVAFMNFKFIKHFFVYFKLISILKNIKLADYDAVFIYDSYWPFLKCIPFLKRKSKNKVLLYLPDLIGHTGNTKSILQSLFDWYNLKIFNDVKKIIDHFIIIAEPMREYLQLPHQKCLVIEGMTDGNAPLAAIDDDVKKYIFYGGSLGARHGILKLIDAFLLADLPDVDLVICGDGDTKQAVEEVAEKNKRIKYLGQLPRREILDLQAKAFLLVNPRDSSGEFTKYSFPSKIFEYFTSGTPSFMYKLKGIDSEYYKYCFSNDDESPEALATSLVSIYNLDIIILKQMAEKARQFILTFKTSKAQVEKIVKVF